MNVLNIAPRQFGKSIICYKNFLESYAKDSGRTMLIICSPRQSIGYHLDKLEQTKDIFKLRGINTFKALQNIKYYSDISLRGCMLRNLFMDDYSWLYLNKRDEHIIINNRSDNIEIWSDQFLTYDEFNILSKRIYNDPKLEIKMSPRLLNSCIYRSRFYISVHRYDDWIRFTDTINNKGFSGDVI